MKTSQLGRLDANPKTSNGRAIDTWSYHTPDPNAPGGMTTIKVPVVMHSGPEGLHFVARMDGVRAPVTDANIQTLREKVEARLAELTEAATGVVWEDWLMVTVTAHDEERAQAHRLQSGLSIEVRPIKVGRWPGNGELYTMAMSGPYAIRLPQPKKSRGFVDRETLAGETGMRLETDEEVAYVPATPENLAALADLRDRLRVLRARLAEVLSAEAITNTLADLSNRLPQLAAPQSPAGTEQSESRPRPR